MGKMMDQGPVLIITFQAQLVMVIRNPKGEVVEGDPVSFTHAIRNTSTIKKARIGILKQKIKNLNYMAFMQCNSRNNTKL